MSNVGQGGGAGNQGGTGPHAAFPQPTPLPHPYLLLLQRWNEGVRPLEQQSFESQKIAADFGKIALNSSVLLNGGALVALPALMQWLNPNGRSLVGDMAMWFPIGLLLIFLAILVAYLNYMTLASGFNCLAYMRGRELDCEYAGKNANADVDWINANQKHRLSNIAARITQIVAVLLAISSYVAFLIGVWGFIELAKNAYIPR